MLLFAAARALSCGTRARQRTHGAVAIARAPALDGSPPSDGPRGRGLHCFAPADDSVARVVGRGPALLFCFFAGAHDDDGSLAPWWTSAVDGKSRVNWLT